MRDLITKDWIALNLIEKSPSILLLIYTFLRQPKFRVLVRLRFSQYFFPRYFLLRFFARLLYHWNLKRGVDIHPLAKIDGGLRLAHPLAIVIGESSIIGKNVRIQQSVTIGGGLGKIDASRASSTMPVIGDYCLLGPGCCISGPIKVGDGVIIGANSVVTKDLDAWSMYLGSPLKKVAEINGENLYPAHYPQLVPEDACNEKGSC